MRKEMTLPDGKHIALTHVKDAAGKSRPTLIMVELFNPYTKITATAWLDKDTATNLSDMIGESASTL